MFTNSLGMRIMRKTITNSPTTNSGMYMRRALPICLPSTLSSNDTRITPMSQANSTNRLPAMLRKFWSAPCNTPISTAKVMIVVTRIT